MAVAAPALRACPIRGHLVYELKRCRSPALLIKLLIELLLRN
jgi:hypothetical protein